MMSQIQEGTNIAEIERLLRKIDQIVRRKGREILKDFNMTGPQFIALQWLRSEGELTIGELSQKMSLACSTITDLIDRMEKGNLVQRVKDQNDKRVVRIKIEPLGHELVQKVLDKRRLFLADRLKSFNDESIYKFKESLSSLYEAMDLADREDSKEE